AGTRARLREGLLDEVPGIDRRAHAVSSRGVQHLSAQFPDALRALTFALPESLKDKEGGVLSLEESVEAGQDFRIPVLLGACDAPIDKSIRGFEDDPAKAPGCGMHRKH